ncbi:hypothetical protein ATCC90586_003272 [Pythium insidiosum]|nr:hypothetical protein ATCC90586_003272 [Pythium insidiosum]
MTMMMGIRGSMPAKHMLRVLQGASQRRISTAFSAARPLQSKSAALSTALAIGGALLWCHHGRDDQASSVLRSEGFMSSQGPERRGRYALYKELGRGGFSVVRLAVDTKTNQLVAAKIFDPKYSTLHDIAAEIETLRHVGKHRNIVSLHDVLSTKNETIMFMDLVEGGELFDYIVDMGSVSERDASHFLRDVCRALEYLHTLGVCHRDLKPENVLLTNRSTDADLKIADFGLSRRQRPGEQIIESQPSGTIAYWAPEIIRREPQDFGVDMWAFGVLVYITLTGVHPFDPRGDRSDAEIVSEIAKGQFDVSNEWYKGLSADAKDLIARLLDPKPSSRLTAKQALDHPWLQGQTTSTTPLGDGHAERLLGYQRLQQLRANILAVMMSLQRLPSPDDSTPERPKETAAIHRTSTVNMDMFKEAFALFDKDESGYIDCSELMRVLEALGQRLSMTEVEAIMRDADTDGDGKISFLEFVAMMNKRLFRRGELTDFDLRAAFKLFDSNDDGFISASELAHVLCVLGGQSVSNSTVKQLIATVDVNDDGRIDFEEFGELMRAGLAKRSTLHLFGDGDDDDIDDSAP